MSRRTNPGFFTLLLVLAAFLVPRASAQHLTVLHSFLPPVLSTNTDGANPLAGLTSVSNKLYGTTANGGLYGAGAIFYVNPDGSGYNALRAFTNTPDAGNPQADLIVDGSRIIGTTFGGGNSGVGAVFVGQTNGSVSRIRNFSAVSPDTATNSGGASPNALVALAGGTLYGTTTAGGAFANGTAFSLTTNGSTFSSLHDFTVLDSATGTNADGAAPWGGLVLSGDTLYGTASAAGAGGGGTVFSVKTNGNNFAALYHFTGMNSLSGTNTDGAIPFGGLNLSSGTLYGTTSAGGIGNSGTIFSIGTNGSGFKVLHYFSPVDPLTGTNADGAKPAAALILSGSTLYGTTPAGGAGASGVIFSLNTNGSQFNTMYSFTATDPGTGTNLDGAYPIADLLLLGNSLYGAAFGGGNGSVGTVFGLSLPLPPATILNIVPNLDSSVTLFLAGSPGSTNFIQTATHLTPPVLWQTISTNIADGSGLSQFTDTNTTIFPIRFYRSYTP